MKEHPQENPAIKPSWRKKILDQMFKDLKRPLITKKGWNLLFNKNSGEYSFLMGSAILYVSEDGQIEDSRVLSNGEVWTNENKEPLVRTLDYVLLAYAQKHSIENPDDDESYEMILDNNPPEDIVKNTRNKLDL